MRQISTSVILQIALYLFGLFGFLFLVNAFLGDITTHSGKVTRKFITTNAQGKPFYRVSIVVNSKVVDIQSQPSDYKIIEEGDSITYYIRRGLFNNAIIEQYNAKIK